MALERETFFRQAPSTLPQYLRDLSHQKSSNLCLTIGRSVSTSAALLDVVSSVGHLIVLLRITPDNIHDWSNRTATRLFKYAQEKEFLVWDSNFLSDGNLSPDHKLKLPRFANIIELDIPGDNVQDNNDLIDEVREAVRNADWSSKGEVRTEIAAERDSSAELGQEEEEAEWEDEEPEMPVMEEDDEDPSLLRVRKASVISLTSTLTQIASDATPPNSASKSSAPSLRRGVVINFSGHDGQVSDETFLEIARQNRDLVLGYFSDTESLSPKLKENAPPEGLLVFDTLDYKLSVSVEGDLVSDIERAVSLAATKATPGDTNADILVVTL